MAGYNSKFTGSQVESLLEKAGSAYQKPTDGIPQSDLDESTQQILQNVENKVSKEEGKGLSTNDFTDEYKAKVEDSASQEGYFPKMSVGIAANLAGRGEATEQVFTYRPTDGGTPIESGVAKIRRVKGNSVAFNQILKNGNFAITTDWSPFQPANVSLNWDNGLTVTSNYAGTGGDQISVRQAIAQPFILGHKYFVHFEFSTSNTSLTPLVECFGALYSNENRLDYVQSGNNYYSINNVKATRTTFCYLKAIGTKAVGDTWTFKNVMIIDLTQMFGAGNEPTTVEKFRALYPDSYYPYNAGKLRNLDCSGIKTVGFNQWDEQWERGTLNSVGENDYTSATIRSKNYIPAIGNKDYYVGIASEGYDNIYYLGISWYDSNKQFISKSYCNQRVITSPINAAYFRIFTDNNSYVYGNTYNNDICINLHHTGYRDGDYEPYKEITHALPLLQITNGEPLRYVYNSSAGEQYDEINETEYIKRIGVVDLGTLDWSWDEGNSVFKTNGLVGNGNAYRFFCSKYTSTNYGFSDMADKTIRSTRENLAVLGIKDSSFGTDASAFKASLAGVMLHYELAEPIVTPIETPLNLDYQAEDFGTEEALLTDNSAPFRADIVYQFNAADRIRENSQEIEQLNTDIASIQSKINFALIPTNGFTPNIDTAKKVLDLGNDPVLCIGNKIYGVSQFPSSFNPRSILIYDADEDSGAIRLLFNKSTCILYAKTVYYTMTDDEILIGTFRLVWGTHSFISAELPFEYTIDGRSLYNTPPTATPTIYSTHSIIHKVSATNKGVLSAGSGIQGCDIYNGLLFQGQDGGVINIFDTENNYTYIGGYQSVLSLHFTNLSFGTEKAEEADEFPLLYIPENRSTGYELYALRVTRDTSELMQTLTFPSDGDIGYYPVSVIDKENGFIYCWCYKKNSYMSASDNAFIITKYALPALAAGDITLTLVDKFEVPYRGVGQGATCDGINLYFQCGLGSSPSYLQIINLQNKCEIGLWDITEHSSSEPEGIAIKDGGLVMTHINNSITFVEFK